MSSELLNEYDKLRERLREAQDRAAVARARHEEALQAQRAIEDRLIEVRTAIARAIDIADEPPTMIAVNPEPADRLDVSTPKERAQPTTSAPTPSAANPIKVSPSLKELIFAFPRDNDTGHEALREVLGGLAYAATHTRIHKAKKRGLVESAGWGRYRLTETGRNIYDQRLRLLPTTIDSGS